MEWRVRVPSAVYRRALDRAGGRQAALQQLVVRWLERYAEGPEQQREAAHARADRLTPERRTEIARAAGLARQAKRRAEQET